MCFAPMVRRRILQKMGMRLVGIPATLLPCTFKGSCSLNPRSTQKDGAGFQVTVRESEWREMDESKEMWDVKVFAGFGANMFWNFLKRKVLLKDTDSMLRLLSRFEEYSYRMMNDAAGEAAPSAESPLCAWRCFGAGKLCNTYYSFTNKEKSKEKEANVNLGSLCRTDVCRIRIL